MSIRVGIFVLVAAALLAAGFWAGSSVPTHSATPRILSGRVAMVGSSGDEFAVVFGGNVSEPASYGLSDSVPWRDGAGVWNEGSPVACMKPLSHGQLITFGVVNVNPVADALGGPTVVWVECPT